MKIEKIVSKWMDNNAPSIYAEGLSWYEALIILSTKINDVIDQINLYFDEDLEDVVTNILNEWLDDGIIQDVISEALQTQIDDVDSKIDAEISGVKSKIDTQISGVNGRVDTVLFRVGSVDGRVDALKNTTNEMDNRFSSQLAQKVDKGNVSVSDINKNLGKLDQTFMSDEFLQQMAGDTPINAVPADGSLTTAKYADKSVTYEKIAEGSVTSGKTDFIKIYKNIYDNDTSVSGGIPNYLTGEKHETSGVMSQHIPVEEGKYYVQSVDSNKAFYDKIGNFVVGVPASMPSPFKVPTGKDIKSVKIGFYDSTPVTNRMLVEGTELPPKYLSYGEMYNENNFNVYNKDITEKAVDYNQTTFLKKIENLFDKSKATKGGLPNYQNGEVFASENGYISDYVPVKPSTLYSLSTVRNIAYYDKGFNFLYGTPEDLSKHQVRTRPITHIAYARYGFYEGAELNNAMVIEGDQLPEVYVPYGEERLEIDRLLLRFLGSQSNLNGLKWNALGDSITQGTGTTKTYIDYIVEATGVKARNYGISGTMISSVPVSHGVGMSVRYADMDDDADIVTVFGGTNDYGHGSVSIGQWGDTGTETLYGATTTLVKGLMSKYPQAKIGFILPIPRHGINGTNDLGNYVNAIKDVCDRYSIPTLDLYHGSGLMPGTGNPHQGVLFNGTDNTHPNAAGHKIIATKIQRFLESL